MQARQVGVTEGAQIAGMLVPASILRKSVDGTVGCREEDGLTPRASVDPAVHHAQRLLQVLAQCQLKLKTLEGTGCIS